MPHLPPRSRRCPHGAFTLIEVVLALGITSFCLVGLIGLFSVGIQAERESTERLEASHIAQSLIAARRASRTAMPPGFPLPPLEVEEDPETESDAVHLNDSGTLTDQNNARFVLSYRIESPGEKELKPFLVYLKISWPGRVDVSDPSAIHQDGSIEHVVYISSR